MDWIVLGNVRNCYVLLEIVRNCKNCWEFVAEFLGLEQVLIWCLHCVDMSQIQCDAAQLKKEGEKKKVNSTMTWHEIECVGSIKKSSLMVSVYNRSRLRRRGRTCYFGPQPKAGPSGTVEDNPVDLWDEEDDLM